MSLYLPDGCTQDALDRALNGDDLPEPDEQDPVWWDEAECRDPDEPGAVQGVDERVNHLAVREMDGSTGRVANPLVSVPDGLGFE